MPSDAPTPPPSPQDRRAYYRITVPLPLSIQAETDTAEAQFVERSVNISGGGLGVTVNVLYNPNDILLLTLLLPDQVIFKSYAEVLRLDSLPYPANTYRLHTRFVKISAQDRELLIRCIMRFQREHLEQHYSA